MDMRKAGIINEDFSSQGGHIEDQKLLEPGAKPNDYYKDQNPQKAYKTTFPSNKKGRLGVKGVAGT